MCGIVGYIGHRSALPVLIDGLKRLEYRGYDSAGIALRNGRGIDIYKTKGKIRDLEEIVPASHLGSAGLGHTRWATHGVPSSINAHPHCIAGVAVVHNGIIENYRTLKTRLLSEGADFLSETDTEVIPQLIAKHLDGGLPLIEAVLETVSMLEGSFALGIMHDSDPATLLTIRKGSPLVIGYGDGEFFFASDITAMLAYTKRFLYLEDGQMCAITPDNIDLSSFSHHYAPRTPQSIVEVDWSHSMAEKNGYDHFMLKEIYEQPAAVADTLGESADTEQFVEELRNLFKNMMGLRRLHIVACGTSYHAAIFGRYIIEELTRIPVSVEIASEYRYMQPIIEHDTLFISITQSGETADTLAAQREARQKGAKTLTICNVVGSTAARESDHALFTRAGPEIGVASTKAFTCQLAALSLLATDLGLKRGRLLNGEVKALKAQLMKVPVLIEKVLKRNSEIEDISRTLESAVDILYLGRGVSYPIALEGALKMKEISYIHAEGYPAGEMKHGAIALIEEGAPVIVLAPMDRHFEKILSNIEEVKARGGRVIAITDEPDSLSNKADEIIAIPSTHPLFSPFVTVVPLQLLAYHVANKRGCDVDQPRNLAKSVTVE